MEKRGRKGARLFSKVSVEKGRERKKREREKRKERDDFFRGGVISPFACQRLTTELTLYLS
jgi:hypothetical protein